MEDPRDVAKLHREKLQVEDIIDSVVSPSCGAISTFIGTTRNNFDNKKVLQLEYEAYDSMATKEMAKICKEVRSRWAVKHIAIHHRLGRVPISEASVVIAVSSPHRQESLKAVEYIIDNLKAKVPIWKKEIYENDEPQWKENKECSWSTKNRGEHRMKSECDSDEDCDVVVIDSNQVQIRADNEELNRRIESFITRKRQQVNAVNVQEFCSRRYLGDEEGEISCARVDAILVRRKDSKSHVKVHRVLNSRGPQTMDPLMLFAETNKCSKKNSSQASDYPALEERLDLSEKYLGLAKPVPRDIYERMKKIEDKILYLESVSPEYKDFWISESRDALTNDQKHIRKRTYSKVELDNKLSELETRYAKKIK
ncbi:molybdopterin synthase catalytic subunit [Venturia canescens]|uniref:molybdopterin synthase catalytic subunit n=1 Tax=Venturia canescens TaxID=32260 RepID=UPI001C9CF506|nr:molybdopterin synthase catalytic subunit [Venturia canescens]